MKRKAVKKKKKVLLLTPSLSPACTFSRLKSAHIHACKQHQWLYNKSTFNTVYFDRCHFTCSCKREKSLNDFKFGTSIGHFPSDSTASTAVKGLNKGVGGGGGGHHLMWWVPLCQQCGLKPLLVRLVVVHCWGGKKRLTLTSPHSA